MTTFAVSRASRLYEAAAAAILPPKHMVLSEWTETHFRLSSESSATPGPIQLFAFQKEPLDCMGPHSGYETVVLVWASQIGKTSMTLAMLAQIIAEDPGPVLFVEPT